MARSETQFKTGNPGRKRGSPNKVTATVREALKSFIEDQRPEFEKAFAKLKPKEKVQAYTRLLPFVTPAYQAINFSLNQMTEDDLKIIIDQLKQQTDEQRPNFE